MKSVHVEYALMLTVNDGQDVIINKERVLPGEMGDNPECLQTYLEKDFRETGDLGELKAQLGKEIVEVTCKVTKVSMLAPTGDDDQM